MDKTQFCGLLKSLKHTTGIIVEEGDVDKHISTLGNVHIFHNYSIDFNDCLNVGLLVISNINAILQNDEEDLTPLFKEIICQFISAIFAHKELSTWANVCQVQMNELLSLLENSNYKTADPNYVKAANLPSTSAPSSSKRGNDTPRSATSDISHIKRFSPLVNEKSKIRCTVIGCSSRFAHKRSYRKHMSRFHVGHKIDHSQKDPPGTCLMISAKTNRPCMAKLPYRSIYYHLQVHHNVTRPENKILFGFDLTSASNPKPVFVSKGEELEPRDEEEDLPIDSDGSSQEIHEDRDEEGGNEEADPAQSQITEQICDIPKVSQETDLEEVGSLDQIPIEVGGSEILNETLSADILNLCNDQKIELIEALEDNIPSDMDGSYLLGIRDPLLNEGTMQDEEMNSYYTSRDCLSSKEMLSEAVAVSPRGEKRKHSKKSKKLSSVFEVEDEILLTQPLFENIHDDPSYEPDSKKNKDSDMSFDKASDEASDEASDDGLEPADSNTTIDERVFSDFEEGDDTSYTDIRKKNKIIRHTKRNTTVVALTDKEENSKFIADFVKFMKENVICTRSNNPTTLSRALRHLFNQEDSLLAFETQRDENFHLDDFRDITSEKFKHLPFPGDWIMTTSGQDGNKGRGQKKTKRVWKFSKLA